MNAALFSGQGSQYPQMGKTLIENDPSLGRIFEAGSDILGWDLKKICFEADASELSKTRHSQPAIMAVSITAFEAAVKMGFECKAVAGHSLGEYAAMYAAKMVSLEDAFRLIKLRSEAMDKAAENSDGTMAAVLKISPERVEQICSGIDGYVTAVNYNSPVQTVIAGERSSVEKAAEVFKAEGARVVPLAVASAFHSKIMQPAADEFAQGLASLGITFKEPCCRVYSNVYGTELKSISDIADLLAKHIVSPVRFTSELTQMKEDGFGCFIEFGPGKVLSGLVKKTLKEVSVYNIETADNLKEAAEKWQ